MGALLTEYHCRERIPHIRAYPFEASVFGQRSLSRSAVCDVFGAFGNNVICLENIQPRGKEITHLFSRREFNAKTLVVAGEGKVGIAGAGKVLNDLRVAHVEGSGEGRYS